MLSIFYLQWKLSSDESTKFKKFLVLNIKEINIIHNKWLIIVVLRIQILFWEASCKIKMYMPWNNIFKIYFSGNICKVYVWCKKWPALAPQAGNIATLVTEFHQSNIPDGLLTAGLI